VVREARAQGVRPPRFGLLRLGTGNALAGVVGASPSRRGMGVAADIARLRRDAGFRPLRLLEVEGTLTPFAGVGLDAIMVSHYVATKELLAKTPLRPLSAGLFSYVVGAFTRTVPYYLSHRAPHVVITNAGAPALRLNREGRQVGAPVAAGEVIYAGPFKMVSCATIPTYGFGFRIFPFAEERQDRMSLRIVNVHTFDAATSVVAIRKGTYRSSRMHDILVDKVHVCVDPPVPYQIGGDPQGPRREITFALADEPIELVDFYAPSPLQPSPER
jgi:diacylglycerol kinase family enzyme